MLKHFSFIYNEYSHPGELSPEDNLLLHKAKEAINSSYAPYSGYHVGAAVLLADGTVVIGSNQENMAFPSTLCAERVACFAAAASKPGIPVISIAISAKSNAFVVSKPVTPCGSCRQVLNEYEMIHNRKIKIIMAGETGNVVVVDSIEQLLPFAFREEELQKLTDKKS